MAILEVRNLGISFGGLRAVNDLSFDLERKAIMGLIGPNGAGKTTVFNLLTAVYPPTDGDVILNGHSLLGKRTHEIVGLGMTRTFQNIRLFKNLSVLDNVKIGFHDRGRYALATGLLRLRSYWAEEKRDDEEALRLLDIFGMAEQHNALAGMLPYGLQRKLEICRALASSPQVLLLDEPAAGMNPTETSTLMETIHMIRDRFGISILLIEHDMSLVMGICEQLLVLDYGEIIARGVPAEIASNPAVIRAYLGDEQEDGSDREKEALDVHA